MDSRDSAPVSDTVRAFLLDLGDDLTISRRLKVAITTIQSWASRNSVPPGYWQALIAMGKTRNPKRSTYQRLAAIHAKELKRGRVLRGRVA